MAEKVKVTLEFDGKNVAVLGQTNKQLEKMDKIGPKVMSALKVGAVAATAAIVGMTAIVKKSLDAFGEQEKSVAMLNQALKNQGNFTQAASLDLQRYASQLQKVTIFGDETILKAQSLIASFGFEGETLKKLTKATLDLAAAKGMDLTAAADLVSKAVGSSTNALTRYGVEIDGAAGSTARAESAVKNITRLFGGQAQAQADTYAGAIVQMNNAIGDTMEVIGEEFAPVIKDAALFIKDNVDVIQDFVRVAGNATRAAVDWLKKYGQFIDSTREKFDEFFEKHQLFSDFFQKYVVRAMGLVDAQGQQAQQFVDQEILHAEQRRELRDLEVQETADANNAMTSAIRDAANTQHRIKVTVLQGAVTATRTALKDERKWYQKHWAEVLAGKQLNAQQMATADQSLADSFSNLATLMGSKNRQLFEIGKAAAIARVTVSTVMGAIDAVTSTAALGTIG
ncbi:MAG: hypothetical protein PHF37_10635, partial [Phycisphaerae bacterium]|nr:hypothetical protein [Phycisphaerae bacterium]